MRRGGKQIIWLLCSMLPGAAVEAAALETGEPYHAIMERNVFNIHPAIQDTSVSRKKAGEPPIITLKGITTILSQKLAILKVASTKPGSAPETLMLTDWQDHDGIKVMSIDEKAGVVEVVNHEERQMLDFEHDGKGPATRVPICLGPVLDPLPPRSPGGFAPLTGETQTLMIEVQRVKLLQEGDETANLLPVAEFTGDVQKSFSSQ